MDLIEKTKGARYHNNNGKYGNAETEGVKSLRNSRGLVYPYFPTNSSRPLPLIPVYSCSYVPVPMPSISTVSSHPHLEIPVPLISNLCDTTLFLLSLTLVI